MVYFDYFVIASLVFWLFIHAVGLCHLYDNLKDKLYFSIILLECLMYTAVVVLFVLPAETFTLKVAIWLGIVAAYSLIEWAIHLIPRFRQRMEDINKMAPLAF